MTLYVVATPIGNLQDITERALEVLRSVEVVIVEKWTDSIKLLGHFGVKPKKLITYDERNRNRVTPQILKLLETHDAAFISSAGTPGLSGPGADLVRQCRENHIEVIPIPGASALTAGISVSGFRGAFLFIGFLPRKISHRKRIFEEAKRLEQNVVCFESPYRIEKTLKELAENFPAANVFLGKEMTKKFETYVVAKPREILDKFGANKNFSKGEFTLIVNFKS